MNTRLRASAGMSCFLSTVAGTRSDSPVRLEHSTYNNSRGAAVNHSWKLAVARVSFCMLPAFHGGKKEALVQLPAVALAIHCTDDMPVSGCAPLTLRSKLSMIRMSAGTLSPMYSLTRSPGTRSQASTLSSWPSRATVHLFGIIFLRDAACQSSKYSIKQTHCCAVDGFK